MNVKMYNKWINTINGLIQLDVVMYALMLNTRTNGKFEVVNEIQNYKW